MDRSKQPLKIVAEVIQWEGHSPEIWNTMLENFKKLSEQERKTMN
jgi:rifampin ADP-ribosylating transferase